MRIAQIAPLMESVPPRLYGGTERIVSYLTEELVAQGHDVTLFASGHSITAARLVPCCAQPLRLNPAVRDIIPYYMMMLDKVRSMASRVRHPAFPHRPVPFPDVPRDGAPDGHDAARPPGPARPRASLRGFPEMPLVSISNAQRAPIPRRELRRHRLPRPAARPADADARAARRLSGLPRPHLAGEARRPRHRDRPRRRPAVEDRRQGRSRGRGIFPLGDRAAARAARHRVHRRDRRPRARAAFLGERARCCSRSTGPSRSASP